MAYVPGRVHYAFIEGHHSIDFGDASIVIFSEWYVSSRRWKFRVYDTRPIKLRASSWVVLNDQSELNTHPRSQNIREQVWAEYGRDGGRSRLDEGVLLIQEQAERFVVEETPSDSTQQEAATEEETTLPQVDEEEVLAILTGQDSINRLKFHLDNMIAGEDENKLTVFILLLSGKATDPDLKQMILFKGEAGAGKSTLMSIADLFNVKDVGRFTAHALDYSELAGSEVLRLKEFGMMDSEEQGVSTIKFLSSDDKGYNVEYTVRDNETGEMVTRQKRIEPITVVTSTTRASVESQFERRCWIFNPDETEAQTERIRLWKVKVEQELNEISLGLRVETTKSRSIRILRAVVKRLQMCEVVILFPDTLTSIMRAVDIANVKIQLRIRGDYTKLITLVKLYGIFCQNSLPSVRINDTSRIVFITPEKVMEIIRFAQRPLTQMLTGEDNKVSKILNVLSSMQYNFITPGSAIDKKLRDDIGRACGWASHSALIYFDQLEDLGYVTSSMEGRTKIFELTYPTEKIKEKISLISSKLRIDGSLMVQMWEEGTKTLIGLSSLNKLENGGAALDFIRGVFQNRRYSPPDPSNPNDDGSISDITRQNGDMTDINRHNTETTIDTIYCYQCRVDITDRERFPSTIDGHPVEICSECHQQISHQNPQNREMTDLNRQSGEMTINQPRILLSERLCRLREVWPEIERSFGDDAIPLESVTDYLCEHQPEEHWTGNLLGQVINIGELERWLFQPRPGFWKMARDGGV